MKKNKDEWEKILDPQTYKITRESGTEAPFTGKYLNNKSIGTYLCICCENKLFLSNTKFDSKSGWPSFYKAIENDNVVEINDYSNGMNRIEVKCSSCDAHLGHVFNDGPEPTGLRYCINSASLKFTDSEK